MPIDDKALLALGELRGILKALAWANEKANHQCTFTVDDLPAAADIVASLNLHFRDLQSEIITRPVEDWQTAISEALHRWLFEICDLLKPRVACALADQDSQTELVRQIVGLINTGLQPHEIWQVEVTTKGHYECAWDDFAISGKHGYYLLHLGVSD
jgi:hypothetical protein